MAQVGRVSRFVFVFVLRLSTSVLVGCLLLFSVLLPCAFLAVFQFHSLRLRVRARARVRVVFTFFRSRRLRVRACVRAFDLNGVLSEN